MIQIISALDDATQKESKNMKPGIDYIAVATPFYCTDGKGSWLLHKRSKNCRDEQGVWDFGSGKLEFSQTLEESVLREVRDKYGCARKILEKLPAFSHLREQNGMKTHWVAVPFIVKVSSTEVMNGDPEKIDEIKWFTSESLPSPLHSGITAAFEKYKEMFKKYSR